MKHLIVAAHPAQDSLTMGLARTYTAELEKLGHSQRTYDLCVLERETELHDRHLWRVFRYLGLPRELLALDRV